MQREIVHIAPIRAANVMSIVYATAFAVFSLSALPFYMFVPFHDPQGNALNPVSMAIVLLLYPVLGAVMGWVGTASMAWLYNVIAPRVGGIRLDVLHSNG
jgi:hypothetical protein